MADLKFDDLCNLIALEINDNRATSNSVKRYLKAIYNVILSQLEINQRIYFKDFGYWEIKERKSGEREINDPKNDGKRLVYIKPRYSIFFKPSVNFDASINEGNFKIVRKRDMKKIQKENKKNNKIVNSTDLINRANSRRKEK